MTIEAVVATPYPTLPVADLQPHPLNRKRFDVKKLDELEASIRQSGILTPLLVRPNGKGFQILAGERRWNVAKKIGLVVAPVRVHNVSDAEAIEFLIVENLQREDVHPLQEAEGYVALMKKSIGYDIDKVAERVGRSKKYVYDRIKLLSLTPEAKQLFLDGHMTAGHAIILARQRPEVQKRAIGSKRHEEGLWTYEETLFSPYDKNNREGRKLVSVRELQCWVDENVPLDPAAADVHELFPETATALTAAASGAETVVHITHERHVRDKDLRRDKSILGPDAWKRADRQHGSKPCEHAVTGVVVIGSDRGDAFRVCVERECAKHWPKQERARPAHKASPAAARLAAAANRRDQEYKREYAERVRWVKATGAILEAAAAKLKTAPVGVGSAIGRLILSEYRVDQRASKYTKLMPRGTSADDLVRHLGFLEVARVLVDDWGVARRAPKLLKPLGINARKIVDQVSPKPKAQQAVQTSAPPKATSKTKKRAGDARRAKARARAKTRA